MSLGTTGEIVEILDDHTARAVVDGQTRDVSTVMLAAQGERIAVGDRVHLHHDIVFAKIHQDSPEQGEQPLAHPSS